jgi:tetratricopeptide (TPR) repeat protein
MKAFILLSLLLVFTEISFGQTSLEKQFSSDWCNCIDSIGEANLNEENLSNCFQIAANKNSDQVLTETKKEFGDTSYQSGYKFGLELYNKVSVSLINSCNTYYHIFDTLRYSDFIRLNKDSIKSSINYFNDTSKNKTDDFYTQRGTMYFQVNNIDQALRDFDSALVLNPNSLQSIYFKAWSLEIKRNYDEAITLYHKLFTVTQKNDFKFFEAIAQRKKNGM